MTFKAPAWEERSFDCSAERCVNESLCSSLTCNSFIPELLVPFLGANYNVVFRLVSRDFHDAGSGVLRHRRSSYKILFDSVDLLRWASFDHSARRKLDPDVLLRASGNLNSFPSFQYLLLKGESRCKDSSPLKSIEQSLQILCALKGAAASNHVEFLEYYSCHEANVVSPFFSACKPISSHLWTSVAHVAVSSGSLDALRWMYNRGLMKRSDFASINLHHVKALDGETLSFLEAHGLERQQALSAAAQFGLLGVLEEAHNNFELVTNLSPFAALGGQIEVLEWMEGLQLGGTNTQTFDLYTSAAAAGGGQLETLKWLRSRPTPCPWSTRVFSAAALNGHLGLMEWTDQCRPNFLPSLACASAAGQSGSVKTLQWVQRKVAAGEWWTASVLQTATKNLCSLVRLPESGSKNSPSSSLEMRPDSPPSPSPTSKRPLWVQYENFGEFMQVVEDKLAVVKWLLDQAGPPSPAAHESQQGVMDRAWRLVETLGSAFEESE
uniref:Uncharacterized protein n=1 Tax=Chromera velia CCMP2878 TaxID=1169474 RepID=A0A0G4H333_9ALVE|eukprot:Cvel_5593.t1-p1 / transcript=Cvel_5593.t1 / gene=Cvel_5593 / organism=Chromera_velia_CCMP2878 / gene_product=hypothetical protein / transcript_product=hypothetical protein / location=Cvel_scaffold263:62468-63949(+) / protein_length=494 / sequence_SO=supercontig / SO=protein_coding / is_pseudo=false